MIFWIFVILCVLAVVFLFVDIVTIIDFEMPFFISAMVGGMGMIFCIVFLLIGHVGVEGKIAAIETEYNMLVYQLENNVYDNDNDLGKRDLYKDVQEWNTVLAMNQKIQDDFWVGIFIPDIYDQFEFIDLEDYK